MKILAIRGRNLASLQGDFELDFSQTPLLGCGLFAITGETGAGKSTILDALCLALYGRYPRITGEGSKDKIANMQGEHLHNSDPRSILRTGSAQGFAQVDLMVGDQHLRAIWEVRRAYGKAEGNLMDFERSLIDLGDDSVLASGKKRVEEEITKRLNLTYEQFGRTVLLAQNDFDAFLRASDTDRADLLEKITGTELYSRISARAFEVERTAFRELEELQRQTGFISVLPDDEREALCDLIKNSKKSHAAHQKQADEVRTSLEWYQRQSEARQQLEKASEQVAKAKQELSNCAEQKQLLDKLRRIESLRSGFDRVRQGQLRCEQLQGEQQSETELQGELQEGLQAAQNNLREHEEKTRRAVQKLADAAPLFERALALDMRVSSLEQREQQAQLLLEQTTKAREKWRFKDIDQQKKAKKKREQISILKKALSLSAAIEPLVARKVELAELFARLGASNAPFDEARLQKERAQSLREQLEERAKLDQRVEKKQRADLERLREASHQKEKILKQARPTEQRLRQEQQMELRAALEPLQHHIRERLDLSALAEKLVKHVAQAERQIEANEGQQKKLQSERVGLKSRADEAGKALARSQKVLSESVLRLRIELEKDQPCPVCGGRDHPGHDDAALGALLDEMRQRSEELEVKLSHNEQEKQRIGEQLATARASLGALAKEEESTRNKAKTVQARTQDLLRPASEAATVLGIKFDLHKRDSEQLVEIDRAQKENGKQIAAARKKLAAIRQMEDEQSSLREKLSTHEEMHQKEAAAQKKRAAELEEVRLALARARLDFERLSERRENIFEQLLPLLKGVDLSRPDLERDAKSAEHFLLAQIKRFESQSQELQKRRDELAQSEKDDAVLQEKIGQLDERLGETKGELSSLQDALGQQRDQRAQLFEGKPVVKVRSDLEGQKEHQQAARQQALDHKNELVTRLGLAKKKSVALGLSLAKERQVHEKHVAQLNEGLIRKGMAREEVESLLAMAAKERDEVVKHYQKRVDDHTRCAGILADRQLHMRQFEEALAPKQNASELADRLKDLQGDLSMAMIELGKNNSRLELDDKARKQRAKLGDKLKKVEKNHARWAVMNEVIGSKDGARFRRFAQTVTLDHLIALANEQLRDINPRYTIERNSIGGLGLQVVDGDMAGEIRSVRSLSGGERFLISLALALGLSRLDGRSSYVDTLMIDEGFGALDARALDIVIEALESLQNQGRKVGVISHVEALTERIPVQVRVEKQGNGRSRVRTTERGAAGD